MKRILKTIGWVFLILIVSYSVYTYQTDTFVKALVNNDESALFYRLSNEMLAMEDLEYIEHELDVEVSIKIYSYEFKPTTTPKANIFLIRGNSRNVSHYGKSIQALVNNGFYVYTLDWRGYGKSTGVPSYQGILTDTQFAFADFQSKTAADSLKTIVYGMSLGGQLAIKIAKDNQVKVDALVLDGSIASAYSFIVDNVEGSILSIFMKEPAAYNQDYMAVRDITAIENIPKLIIHSEEDRAVSFERGESIYDAAQEPKEFWKTNTEHIKTLEDLTTTALEKMESLIE